MNTAGAVLTGGRSRRMGTDKALLDVEGVSMAERVAAALAAGGCEPVVFVGGNERRLRSGGRDWYADRWPGEGPVGGVLTALHALGGDVVVAACDLVDLDGGTVAALLAAASATEADVVAARSDRLEPMLARWRQSSRSTIEECFVAGERALHRVLTRLAVVQVVVDPARLRNVNADADLGRPSANPQ